MATLSETTKTKTYSPVEISEDTTELFKEQYLKNAGMKLADMEALTTPSGGLATHAGNLAAFTHLSTMLNSQKPCEDYITTDDGVLIPDFSGTLTSEQVGELDNIARSKNKIAPFGFEFSTGFKERINWFCEMLNIV